MTYYDQIKPKDCSGVEFDILLSLGWYPMNQTIFTTSHLFSNNGTIKNKVYWLRYPLNSVKESKSSRRIRSKNKHFKVEVLEPFTHRIELDKLYEKYLNSIDFDGYPSIQNATFNMDDINIYNSKAIIIRDEDRIISCGIFYEGNTSAASILHFYDPEYKKFSPGKYLILKTLDYSKLQGKEWYYPGYVVQGDPKMNYKLFLGEDIVQYYNPEPHPLSGSWLPFKSDLL